MKKQHLDNTKNNKNIICATEILHNYTLLNCVINTT